MIGGEAVLGLIPARGGSKGVPRKNLRLLGGKPLIAWTIEAARAARCLDRLILSSDDAEIIETARAWGCEVPFVRPPELARDDTPGILPVLHAIEQLPGYGYVVLLQPTSPLRTAEDIDACVEKCASPGAPACVSVCEVEKSPYWMYSLDESGRLAPLLLAAAPADRRQELPPIYALNGAIYVGLTSWLRERRSFLGPDTVGYPMPPERSSDVDTELDFEWCEFLLRRGSAAQPG